MKKLIAVLLVAVMCFSLVACGGETPNTDDNSEQEQQTQNGNNEPEVTNPDVSEPDNTEPENTEPQYETVEITIDNWQEYFEIIPYVEVDTNAFDEYDDVNPYYTFALKETFRGHVVDCDLAVEVTGSFARLFKCELDLNTNQAVFTPYSESDYEVFDDNYRFRYDYYYQPERTDATTFEVNGSNDGEITSEEFFQLGRYSDFVVNEEKTLLTMAFGSYMNIEVTRIQGTLTLK